MDTLETRAARLRDARLAEAKAIIDANPDTYIAPENWQAYRAAIDAADKHQKALDISHKAAIQIRREPRVYEKASPHSFFADVAASSMPLSPNNRDAKARLKRHHQELAAELRNRPTSPEARYIASTAKNMVRTSQRAEQEFRAMSSGSGSGLSFVTPQYIVQEYVLWRENPPSFTLQMPVQSPGEYGMTVNLPAFGSGASATKQLGDGGGSSTTDATAGYLSGTLSTFSGSANISQQLYDRSGPNQNFDTVIYWQIRQEYDSAIDTAVIAAVVSAASGAGNTITDNNPFGLDMLYGDIYKARSLLTTSAGTKLRPTHVFFPSVNWAWIASQVDSQKRPLIVPNAGNPSLPIQRSTPQNEDIDGKAEGFTGFTGYAFSLVAAYEDSNIAASGSNAQILVVNAQSVYPFIQPEPTLVTYPETNANNLEVVVRLHGYATTIIRHAAGSVVITGSAYPANPTFAG